LRHVEPVGRGEREQRHIRAEALYRACHVREALQLDFDPLAAQQDAEVHHHVALVADHESAQLP